MKHLNAEIISVLDELVALNQASELGFETAAEHAREPALKVLLRDFARQRARFAAELRSEIIAWGGVSQRKRNRLAALHRGWIDLKAGLTVGRANETHVVLMESLRGEQHALRRYRAAMQSPLPVAVVDRLQRQAETIEAVCNQLESLAECGEERLVLQLFPDGERAHSAAIQLSQGSMEHHQVLVTSIRPIQAYQCQCQRQRVLECASAGALSGAAIGGVLGVVVGVGLLLVGEIGGAFDVLGAAVVLAGGFGCLFGALVGLTVGQGVTGEDSYVYQETARLGGVLSIATQRAEIAREQPRLRSGFWHER